MLSARLEIVGDQIGLGRWPQSALSCSRSLRGRSASWAGRWPASPGAVSAATGPWLSE